MAKKNTGTPVREQREVDSSRLQAGDDRRALLKKLGHFGAYTAPAMIAILTPAPQAAATSPGPA